MGAQDSWGERPDMPSVAAHAFSTDGRIWHSLCYGTNAGSSCAPWLAYNGTTHFSDGSTKLLQFERPKMVLDPVTRDVLVLFNSVGRHGRMVVGGNDRSYTIARPLRASGMS